jgi:threonine synthase
VGNAGNITAYWKGFKEYFSAGKATKKPKMYGFQAEGAAPIVRGYAIEKPETVATAIRIGNPASWKQAEAARDESGGLIEKVTDEEITIFLAAVDATKAQEGPLITPDGEQLYVHRASIDSMIDALERHTMRGSPVIIGLQWLALNRERIAGLLR